MITATDTRSPSAAMSEGEGEWRTLGGDGDREVRLLIIFDSPGHFARELVACLIIVFLVFIPLIIKIRMLMRKFNANTRPYEYDAALSLTASQITLRVPENGGVE
jgi:hypothetical protein